MNERLDRFGELILQV